MILKTSSIKEYLLLFKNNLDALQHQSKDGALPNQVDHLDVLL